MIFDAKVKFNEYVTMEENGEIVTVKKYRKTSFLWSENTWVTEKSLGKDLQIAIRNGYMDCDDEVDNSYKKILY